MSQVLRQEFPDGGDVVVLSGPSFASELARKLPTAIVAAGDSPAVVESVMAHFPIAGAAALRQQRRVGVELGGSLKNIIAIAAGVVEGWASAQRACGADHARSRRTVAARRRAWRATRHARRARRPWRSRADVHRRLEPQPRVGLGSAQGQSLRTFSPAQDGCRRRADDRGGARA
jgi:hypothetical protein